MQGDDAIVTFFQAHASKVEGDAAFVTCLQNNLNFGIVLVASTSPDPAHNLHQ